MKLMALAGCVVSWMLFPLVVAGGAAALFLIAAGTELLQLVTPSGGDAVDPSAAREMATRICLGYRAPSAHQTC